MFIQKRSQRMIRVIKGLLAVALVVSFIAAGLTRLPARATEGTGVFLPVVIRDSSYEESIGVLDDSFSDDGWLLTNYSGSLDYGYSILAQPDGKLLVAGAFDGTSQDFGLVRLNPDGTLDLTFGDNGRVHTDFFGNNDVARAIALQADGYIVIAGSAYKDTADKDEFALVRYTSTGMLDTTFGENGLVFTDFFSDADTATGIVVQTDKTIVVAGYAYNGANYDFALARYTEDGVLDPNFSVDGRATTDYNNRSNKAFALVLAGEKLIVVGEAHNGSNNDFALACYNADGTLDTNFGEAGTGIVLTNFANSIDSGKDIIRKADGKLIVAGYATVGDNIEFAMARYDPDGTLDDGFGVGGMVTTDIFGGQDYGYGIIEQPDGKLVMAGYSYGGVQNDFALARYSSTGALDSSFDGDGKVYRDYAGRSEFAYGLVRQADGGLVAAGYMLTIAGSDFTLARFNDSGALDPGFSEDGWAVVNLFGSSDQAFAAAIAPDGTLVLAGTVDQGTGSDFAVARYDAQGDPDLSFDFDGRVVTDVYGIQDYAYATAIQSDGKIVAAGTAFIEYDDDFALVRYKTDGSLDPSFGGDGRVISNYADDNDGIYAILVQTDGKLLVAGEAGTATGLDFALARYHPDGSLDTSFGSGGWVVTDFFGDDDFGRALARQPDGKLLVAGYATNGAEYDFALARYNTNGSLDTTFSGDGKVTTDFYGDDEGHAIAWRGDGAILVAGWTFNGTDDDFAVVCYTSSGSLDAGFDGDGRLVSNISGFDDHATAIGVQPDSKLVLAGSVNSLNDNFDFALARYLPNGSLDPGLSENGWLALDFYAGNDFVQALVMQPRGELVLAGYADNGTDYDFTLVRYR